MNTLRAKLALLLVVAIVSVVGLLTIAMLYFLGPPGPLHSIEPVASQVEQLIRIASQQPRLIQKQKQRSPGPVAPQLTDRLRATLSKRGHRSDVVVSRDGRTEPLVVSIPLHPQGWIYMKIPDLPPQGGAWKVFFGWLAMITFGSTAIAIFVANRMVQPLVLLETAVERVGPDGVLPELPERGPAEVRAAAHALNTLTARLKSAVESRMRLVAAAGHDLRTPMTRMRLRAEFVTDNEERELWLHDIDELERIADSAILLVREDVKKSPLETIPLDELVTEIVSDLKQQNLNVSTSELENVKVRANRISLSRALRNLIINAATHGANAEVAVVRAGNNMARVTIVDEGPGIPEELMSQVFEPFFRVDPARRQSIAGAGLGLSIARDIVSRAGGKIEISNRQVGGLMQVIELPGI